MALLNNDQVPRETQPTNQQPATDQSSEQAQGGELEVSQQAQPYVKMAEDILYGDDNNFKNLTAMLQQHGPEGFPQAMANAVNATLEKLEEKEPLPDEIVAEVGVVIFTSLLEDISMSEDMFPVDQDMMFAAIQATFQMWIKKNPGRLTEEEFQQALSEAGGAV